MPSTVAIPSVHAVPLADRIVMSGVIRDFSDAHPDFGVAPVEGYGHYAGLVVWRLNARGRPVFVG